MPQWLLAQVDTPVKKLLVAVGVGYLALVLFVPTLNVFYQVSLFIQSHSYHNNRIARFRLSDGHCLALC